MFESKKHLNQLEFIGVIKATKPLMDFLYFYYKIKLKNVFSHYIFYGTENIICFN